MFFRFPCITSAFQLDSNSYIGTSFDQLTFAVDGKDKVEARMLVVWLIGSDFRPGTALAPLDFPEPYLRALFNCWHYRHSVCYANGAF